MAKKKPQYFDVIGFATEVMEAMKLGEMDEELRNNIRDMIIARLSDRIMATILSGFGPREMTLYENIVNDHPELEALDVIFIISHEIKGLKEKLENEINSLFGELTYDAQKIDQILKARAAAS